MSSFFALGNNNKNPERGEYSMLSLQEDKPTRNLESYLDDDEKFEEKQSY